MTQDVVKFEINDRDDRRAVITALANAGYSVYVEEYATGVSGMPSERTHYRVVVTRRGEK